MEALETLLNHPYIIIKQLAKELYKDSSRAAYIRLYSRSKGKHRFTKDEYKELHKILLKFAKDLDKTTEKIKRYKQEKVKNTQKKLSDLLRLPCLQISQIAKVLDNTTKENYYRRYDQLRQRTKMTEAQIKALIAEMQNLANFIRSQLSLAEQEVKNYQFSEGKGQHSHILDN